MEFFLVFLVYIFAMRQFLPSSQVVEDHSEMETNTHLVQLSPFKNGSATAAVHCKEWEVVNCRRREGVNLWSEKGEHTSLQAPLSPHLVPHGNKAVEPYLSVACFSLGLAGQNSNRK